MVGNPFVWWLNLLFLLIFPFILAQKLFLYQRAAAFSADGSASAAKTPTSPLSSAHMSGAGWLYLGWCLHYLPFFLMGRALYVHHYYPALVFSTCLTGVLVDAALQRLAAKARLPILGALAALLVFCFRLFSPLVYGFKGDSSKFENSSIHHLHWLEDWYF